MGVNNIALLFPGDDIVAESESLVVTDLGDGYFSVTGPGPKVVVLDEGTFSINSPQVTDNSDGTFTVSSE